jgi:hypothetical protein
MKLDIKNLSREYGIEKLYPVSTFDKHLDQIVSIGKKYISDGAQGVSPLAFVICAPVKEEFNPEDIDDYPMMIIDYSNLDFNDTEIKMDALYDTGVKLAQNRAIVFAVFISSEAWLSKTPIENVDKDSIVMPSKDPNRLEVMITFGLSINNDSNCSIQIMERKEDGSIELVPDSISYATDVYGNMNPQSNLLMSLLRGYLSEDILPTGRFSIDTYMSDDLDEEEQV